MSLHLLVRSSLARSALLAGILVAVSACDSPAERLADHYESGVKLAEQGEPEKAILEFRNALAIDETHVGSLYGLAEALEATGELRGAVGHLIRVVEVDAKHVRAHVKLAQAMLLGGALAEAREHADAAFALEPENPDVLAARAAVSMRLGNVQDALGDAQTALAIDPDHVEAGTILIADRMQAGDHWDAMQLVDRFLESNPENLPLNVVKLRLLELDANKQAELGQHLERLIEIYPEEPGFRQALAGFHHRNGDDDAALAVMRELADLDPADTAAPLQLARFLKQVRGEDAARAELETRVEGAANGAAAFPYHQAIAALDIAAGDRDAAKARFDRVIAEEGLPDARIARARLAIAEEDRTGALTLVNEVLESDPRNVEALALKAALEIDGDDPDAAVLTIHAALGEAPERLDLLRLAATAHERTGNIQIAGENLAKAVRVSDYAPEQTLAYLRFLRQRGRTEAAGTVLEEALRRYPNDRKLLSAAGEIRLALGDWDAAEEAASRLAALDGEKGNILARRIAAAALHAQGRTDETIGILEAIAGRPESDGALAQLVDSYVEADRAEEAVAAVDEVLKEDPEDASALLLRGALHLRAGEIEAAAERYSQAVAAAPEAPAPHLELMRFHLARNDQEAARKTVEEGIELVPSPADRRLRLALAGLQEAAGDFDRAIETYQALYAERPESLVVANNLASLLSDHRADDPDSVALAAKVARRLDGSPIPQFQDTHGWTLHLTGDHGAALGSLRKAVEAMPDNPWVQFHIGQTYAALEEAEKAREHLNRARELGGEDFPRLGDIERTLERLKNAEAAPGTRAG